MELLEQIQIKKKNICDEIRKIVEIRTRGQDDNKKNGKEIVQNETLAQWYENMVKYLEWLILEELLQYH